MMRQAPVVPPRSMVYEDENGKRTPCLILAERKGYKIHEYRVRLEREGKSDVEHWVPVKLLLWPTPTDQHAEVL